MVGSIFLDDLKLNVNVFSFIMRYLNVLFSFYFCISKSSKLRGGPYSDIIYMDILDQTLSLTGTSLGDLGRSINV